jgi:integrase
MGEALARVLSAWRQQTPYCQPTDFVFASFKSDGAVPLAMGGFVADHLRPAAIEAGVKIEKGQRFGLHNLRHSLSHWLVNKGKVEPDHARPVHAGRLGRDVYGSAAIRRRCGLVWIGKTDAGHVSD